MSVDAGGDADVGVAEEFFDHDEFDSLFQEQGRGGMPEVVEADAAKAGAAEDRVEEAGEVGRVDWSALHSDEHVPAVLPRGARGIPFALLPFAVELQRVDAAGERAMRRSEARGLVGSVVRPPALVRPGPGRRASFRRPRRTR